MKAETISAIQIQSQIKKFCSPKNEKIKKRFSLVLTIAYKTTLIQKNNVMFYILTVVYLFTFICRSLYISEHNFYVLYISMFIFHNLQIIKHNFYVAHLFTFIFPSLHIIKHIFYIVPIL